AGAARDRAGVEAVVDARARRRRAVAHLVAFNDAVAALAGARRRVERALSRTREPRCAAETEVVARQPAEVRALAWLGAIAHAVAADGRLARVVVARAGCTFDRARCAFGEALAATRRELLRRQTAVVHVVAFAAGRAEPSVLADHA